MPIFLNIFKDFITNIYIMEEPNINYKRLYKLSIIKKNNLLKEIDNQKNELINCKNEIIDLTKRVIKEK